MHADELPKSLYYFGLSDRKIRILKQFLAGRQVCSLSDKQFQECSALLLWGSAPVPGVLPEYVKNIRVEDGFIRSVGLGSDLVKPVSWVFDVNGIYYDATQPSDLELIFQHTRFDDELYVRADRLRQRIVDNNLTKYNVGTGKWKKPVMARRVILVPGQVESDASLAYGAPGIKTNMGLLQAVREAHPGAWVVYKPHPDVLAGLRAQGTNEEQSLAWCDEQVSDVSMGELLPLVDELHTLTSLSGFEALLRGKKVVCYGQPFYSGWGLTTDLLPIARRTRRLTLDELVAGALILYPTYISRITGRYTTPEQTLDELLSWREEVPVVSFWIRLKRIVLRQVVGVR